jgi:ketosteroid isomerase-like protein
MSTENVELTYRAHDAFTRGNLDVFLALCDEDVEIYSRLAALAEGSYRGHDGVRRWVQNLLDAFPDFASEALEVRDLGDVTLEAVRVHGHGGQSGAPVDQTIWQVVHWRDGKAIRFSSHDSEAEALEAAGLSE